MNNNTQLTSAELASIWTSYMQDSMSACILGYFLTHVDDEDIKSIVQFSYNLSSGHLEKLESIFKAEKIPIPTGFNYENDTNMKAPRLYTDPFILTYINHMSKIGMLGYSGFVSMSARGDIMKHYIECLTDTSQLYEKSSKVLLEKGIFVRAPYIPYPTEKDYIDARNYLSGLNPFSTKRPLNTVEISHLFMNIQTNIMGLKLATSFAQTSPKERVRKWMLRGRDISKKHVQLFTKILLNNDIQPPVSSDIAITDSTTPPFSDKLTMFHMAFMSTAGTGNYATAAAASQRSDLILNYERLSLEIAQYAKDGADIMIDNTWLEQPPTTKDKNKLASKKENKK